MKTLKQLKQGETEQFKFNDDVIQLFSEHGRLFIIHKRGRWGNFTLSFNTFAEAKKEYLQRVETLKMQVVISSEVRQ